MILPKPCIKVLPRQQSVGNAGLKFAKADLAPRRLRTGEIIPDSSFGEKEPQLISKRTHAALIARKA
jgi:hypothetical protein